MGEGYEHFHFSTSLHKSTGLAHGQTYVQDVFLVHYGVLVYMYVPDLVRKLCKMYEKLRNK